MYGYSVLALPARRDGGAAVGGDRDGRCAPTRCAATRGRPGSPPWTACSRWSTTSGAFYHLRLERPAPRARRGARAPGGGARAPAPRAALGDPFLAVWQACAYLPVQSCAGVTKPSLITVSLDVVLRDRRSCRAAPRAPASCRCRSSPSRWRGGFSPWASGTASSADVGGDLLDRLVDRHELLAGEDPLQARDLGVLAGDRPRRGSMLAPFSAAIAPPAMPSLAT